MISNQHFWKSRYDSLYLKVYGRPNKDDFYPTIDYQRECIDLLNVYIDVMNKKIRYFFQ